jgi:predicted protein tyrosine phosphatase
MQISVSNRADIQAGIALDVPYIVISIHDPDTPPAAIPPDLHRQAVLTQSFHDCTDGISIAKQPDVKPMTADHAVAIRDFILLHKPHIDAIVVHCEQGFSRSPGIAAAIAESLGLDPKPFWQNYKPSYHVYNLVLDAFESSHHPF